MLFFCREEDSLGKLGRGIVVLNSTASTVSKLLYDVTPSAELMWLGSRMCCHPIEVRFHRTLLPIRAFSREAASLAGPPFHLIRSSRSEAAGRSPGVPAPSGIDRQMRSALWISKMFFIGFALWLH